MTQSDALRQQEIPEEKAVQAALKQVSGGIGETSGVACVFAEEEC